MSAPPGSPTPTFGPTARLIRQTVFGLLALPLSTAAVRAQDLVPGAYAPAPIGFNVVTVSANVSGGDIAFDPSLPVEDARATLGVTFLGFARALCIAGRSADSSVGWRGTATSGLAAS